MLIGLLHAHYNASHLKEVIEEMRTRGAPTIKAVWMECYGIYTALEGCHRLRAAQRLGLTPIIDEVEYSDDLTDDGNVISYICDDILGKKILDF